MTQGDFYGSEQSISMPQETTVSIELHKADGTLQKLKEGIPMLQGEVMDAATMSIQELKEFFEQEIDDAKESGMCVDCDYSVPLSGLCVAHTIVS